MDSTNKRQEFEHRARECVQGLHGLMTEAARDGFAIEVKSCLDTGGQPITKIAVLLR